MYTVIAYETKNTSAICRKSKSGAHFQGAMRSCLLGVFPINRHISQSQHSFFQEEKRCGATISDGRAIWRYREMFCEQEIEHFSCLLECALYWSKEQMSNLQVNIEITKHYLYFKQRHVRNSIYYSFCSTLRGACAFLRILKYLFYCIKHALAKGQSTTLS